jgi:predicted TIM-barrel fold metal-dependent hydrolase
VNYLSRRNFIGTALAGTTFLGLKEKTFAAPRTKPSLKLIDVNVNLSRWPLRRIRYDDTATLAGMLQQNGVVQAWAGTFDGLLHKDVGSANVRLADECRRYGKGILLPFGSINPKSPNWEEELRRCAEEHHMTGIRLNPNYHGYKLDEPELVKLLKLATNKRLIVQLALLMEDERMMHPLLRVPQVDPKPLAAVLKESSGVRLVLLNATGKLTGQPLKDVTAAGQVFVEISTLEGVGGISNLLTQIPTNRVLFGSHAPLFYFESAVFKLKESVLDSDSLHLISRGNAERLTETKSW